MKVLIIEDNQDHIRYADEIFKNKNDELIVCENGRKAEKKLREIDIIDLLITDLFLPFKEEEDPDYMVGLQMFARGANMLVKKRIRRLAMVTEYDHHRDRGGLGKETEKLLWYVFNIPQRLERRILCFFDNIPVEECFFLDERKGDIIPFDEARRKGLKNFKILKPYHLIRRWAAGEENK